MRTIYKTDNGILSQKEAFEPDVWINLISPNMEEMTEVADYYDIDIADVRAALDEEESSRVQMEDGYTLILVDIPFEEIRNEQRAYTTIPLGILLVQSAIITVCGDDTVILNYFYNNRMRGFSTKKKMRFVYQILLRATNLYQALLRAIEITPRSCLISFATPFAKNSPLIFSLAPPEPVPVGSPPCIINPLITR